MYTTITARVIDQTLQITNIPKLASGGENDVRVEVSFDSLWSGFGKTAIFYRKENQVYHVVMVSDTCLIPREVLAEPGKLYFGILGTSGATVRTTETVAFNVVQGAITAGVSQPLPDVYRQLMSAYGKAINDIAVERARLDNQLSSVSTDGELVDVRVGADGTTYTTAGEAVREQFTGISKTIEAALPGSVSNLFNPFTAQSGMALADATGDPFGSDSYWITDAIDVSSVTGIVLGAAAYKMLWYDTGLNMVKITDGLRRGASYEKPDGTAYVRVQFLESVTPYADRFSVVICDMQKNLTDVPTLGQWFEQQVTGGDVLLNLFDVDERNLLNPLKCLPKMCFASNTGVRYHHESFWTTDYIPVNGISGLRSNVSVYKVGWFDANRNILGTGLSSVPDGAAYVLAQFEEANVPYASRFNVVLCDSAVEVSGVRPHYHTTVPVASEAIGRYGEYAFAIPLTNTSYMSDHTFIGERLYVINASSDDHSEYAPVTVYDVNPEAKTSAYVKKFNHNLGHANSIDYCANNGCLVLGNGSSDSSLPGEIYILPDAANKETWYYSDCIKIDVSAENWGIKTNVVWGEHNNGEYNIVYVITNNNANVRKLLLTKTNGKFDGGYVLLGEWTTDAVDVNQGTVYRNGKLYVAIGHSQLWALEMTLNADGSVTKRQIKDIFFDASGAVCAAPFSEGITIENRYAYVGASDGRVLVYKMS